MRSFRYRAADSQGRMREARMDALDAAELEGQLARRGLTLLHCRPAVRQRRRLRRREQIELCFHLEHGLRAGLPLLDCLRCLAEEQRGRLGPMAAALAETIEEGRTLSQALAGQSQPPVLVNLLDAGERSGELPRVLADFAEYLKWQDELASRIWQLLLYPALTLLVVAGVSLFLVSWRVPQLEHFLQSLGRELPLRTRLLLAVAAVATEHGHWLLAAAGGTALALAGARASHGLRLRLDAWLLRLPLLGALLRKIALARVAAALRLLYGAGLSLLECLALVRHIAGNRAVERAVGAAGEKIRDGAGLAEGFREAGLFPPLALRMIRIGEHTGALEHGLRQVCYFYERDVREAAERMQTLLGPALTLFLGALIAWIALALLGPVYELVLALPL